MKVTIVAGEASGDRLGAGLINALRQLYPDVQCEGVAGPLMVEAGCIAWERSERLAVMGLAEVLAHLPGLLRIRRTLRKRLLASPPDLFVGIDSPDFNLPLAKKVRAAGVPAVQYVSPQFWAWRPGRVKSIATAVELVLCLFPFEKAFYDEHHVAATFVGHPLADLIPDRTPREPARERLGLRSSGSLVALLPGSRGSELKRLGDAFAGAARWLSERRPEISFVAPMASRTVREMFEASLARSAPGLEVTLLNGGSQEAIAAADAVLLASGTATLETMLIKRPMVVAYRVAPLTRWLMRQFNLLRIDRYAMPNLLAGETLVPELMQENAVPARLGAAVLQELDTPGREQALSTVFARLHAELRCNASARAALALAPFLGPRGEQRTPVERQ